MKNFLEKLLDIWCDWWFLIIIVSVILLGYIYEKNNLTENTSNPMPYSSLTESEQIEILKEENNRLKESLSDVNSELEDLQKEYQDATSLIYLLQEQLEDNGIEPYEL